MFVIDRTTSQHLPHTYYMSHYFIPCVMNKVQKQQNRLGQSLRKVHTWCIFAPLSHLVITICLRFTWCWSVMVVLTCLEAKLINHTQLYNVQPASCSLHSISSLACLHSSVPLVVSCHIALCSLSLIITSHNHFKMSDTSWLETL